MISGLIVNILRVLLIKKMMELFLPAEDGDGKRSQAGFILYCLLTTAVYSICGISVLYEVCNYLGMTVLTLVCQGTWKKRLWVSLVLFSMDMGCSLAVYFAFGQNFIMNQLAIQTLLLLICVMVINHITCPADSREIAFDKWQT